MTSIYPIESTNKNILSALKEEVFFSRTFKFDNINYKNGIFSWRFLLLPGKCGSRLLNVPDIIVTLNENEIPQDDKKIVIEIVNNGNIARKLSLLAGFMDIYIVGKNLINT
jgi:hypothetical protein